LKRKLLIIASLILLTGCVKYNNVELTTNNTLSLDKILFMTTINNPLVISHRGTPIENPEHSFAGYNQAIAEGSQFIELDLRISTDNILYVCHDNNLFRTTGVNLDIYKSTSKEIQSVKLPNGENIHQLSEIFKYYKNNIYYVIETKEETNINHNIDNILLDIINAYDLKDFVIIQSFSLKSLMYIHLRNPEIQLMLLLKPRTQEELLVKIKNTPKFIRIISFDLTTVTSTLVNFVKQTNKIPAVYTIKGPADIRKAIKYRLEGFFTDDTKGTLEILQKNKGALALPNSIL